MNIGEKIVEHPDIKAISFTGGTKTGKIISNSASSLLKKVSLELGGKNPVIIFDDCNYKKMLKDINFNKIPISNSAKVILSKYPKLKQLIINGGDDYELLFTGKKGLDSNKNITEIGKMKKGRNINITDFDDITNLDGYKHKF